MYGKTFYHAFTMEQQINSRSRSISLVQLSIISPQRDLKKMFDVFNTSYLFISLSISFFDSGYRRLFLFSFVNNIFGSPQDKVVLFSSAILDKVT